VFCSRSSVYSIVPAYRAGTLGWTADEDGTLAAPVRTTVLMPWLRRVNAREIGQMVSALACLDNRSRAQRQI